MKHTLLAVAAAAVCLGLGTILAQAAGTALCRARLGRAAAGILREDRPEAEAHGGSSDGEQGVLHTKIAASRKPNSVSPFAPFGAPADDDHSSGPIVTDRFKRPTR